ncbi:MAG TPA: hypothetical protein VN767_17565 [Streptosporangiaceae bacterium]|nr:hypothetical protein [Streptosporangiaceae bacterium]
MRVQNPWEVVASRGKTAPAAAKRWPTIKGRALADKQDYGQVFSVSCAAPGNCTAGGFYASNAQRGFVTQSR